MVIRMTPRWPQQYRSESTVTAWVFTVGGLIALVARTIRATPSLEWLAFFALWMTSLWRIALVGLYVGDDGVKVRTIWWSRVVPWSAVAQVWAGPATGHDATAVWISTTTGADVETPIWRRDPSVGHQTRVLLDADTFTRLIADLRARGRDAWRPDDPVAPGR